MEQRDVKEKNRLPLIIAGVAIVLIAIIAFIFLRGNKDEKAIENQNPTEANEYVDDADYGAGEDTADTNDMEESYSLDEEGGVQEGAEDPDAGSNELSADDPLSELKMQATDATNQLENLDDSSRDMFITNVTNATSKEDISSILKNAVEINSL